MRVVPAAEPPQFDAVVRIPGLLAIAELVGEAPPRRAGKRYAKVADRREEIPAGKYPPFWREVLPDLMREYREICAYCCIRIHPVTGGGSVDHFVPKSEDWSTVYEWNNYRPASRRMNSRKRDFPDVLDPFVVSDDWFRLELFAFQVVADPAAGMTLLSWIERTIDRLGLNDEDLRRDREQRAQSYFDREVRFRTLERESPFVARELRRQGRLHAEDRT